jgi:hypothetical protein
MRLVLVDNRIRDHQSIIESLTNDTEYLNFEFRSDIESIKTRITKSYESVAIIQHNYELDVYRLVFDFSNSIVHDLETVDPALDSWQEYIDFLRWLKTERGVIHIDLLACNLWANANWWYMIHTVRTVHDIHIRASIDITGEDGNFILESDGVDTIGIYFTESILQYKYNFYYNADPKEGGNVNYVSYVLPPHNLAKLSSRFASFTGNTPSTTYTDIVSITVAYYALAILRSTGDVVLYGYPAQNIGLMPCGVVTQSQLVNIKKVIASGNTFVALKNDGTVVAWGFVSYNNGQNSQDLNTISSAYSHINYHFINVDSIRSQLVNVVDIYTNGYQAYAALTSSGKVVTWGYYIRGGNKGTAETFLSSGIVKVFPGLDSFVALKNDGTAVSWGRGGPVFSTTYYTNSKPIVNVFTTRAIDYIALYIRKYGTITDMILSNSATPLYTFPPDVFILKVLSYIKYYQTHFFVLLSNNTVASYQNSSTFILYNNVTDIAVSSTSIGMIQNGVVVVSGDASSGGSLTDATYATYGLNPAKNLNLNNPVRLVSGASSIGVIKSDNTFVWLGRTHGFGDYYSGTFPKNATETTLYNAISSNVKNIYSCDAGYMLVKTDGSFVSLGPNSGVLGAQKTTNYDVKDAGVNVYFNVDAAGGFIPLEIPYLPLVTPSSIPNLTDSSVSYYVSNPDMLAISGRKYTLYHGSTLIDTFSSMQDTHTYVFSKVNMPTPGTFTLDIKDVTTITYTVTSFQITVYFSVSPVYPCFLQGSKILRFNPETYQDEYVLVESLRHSDLIATAESGYKQVHSIGYKTITNPKSDSNPSNRLYKFSKMNCKEIFEPLYITGEHCTLHRYISDKRGGQIRAHMGDVYITEEFYRIPAFLDERAEAYDGEDEPATIWHFALEHENVAFNYGVWANGLLVESCAIESLKEKSGMRLLMEDE